MKHNILALLAMYMVHNYDETSCVILPTEIEAMWSKFTNIFRMILMLKQENNHYGSM